MDESPELYDAPLRASFSSDEIVEAESTLTYQKGGVAYTDARVLYVTCAVRRVHKQLLRYRVHDDAVNRYEHCVCYGMKQCIGQIAPSHADLLCVCSLSELPQRNMTQRCRLSVVQLRQHRQC